MKHVTSKAFIIILSFIIALDNNMQIVALDKHVHILLCQKSFGMMSLDKSDFQVHSWSRIGAERGNNWLTWPGSASQSRDATLSGERGEPSAWAMVLRPSLISAHLNRTENYHFNKIICRCDCDLVNNITLYSVKNDSIAIMCQLWVNWVKQSCCH